MDERVEHAAVIEVDLSRDEIWQSIVVAASRKLTSDRRRENGKQGRQTEHYNEVITWDQEIESAAAEIAVARWRNRYWWGGSFDLRGPGTDAGSAQVRWTQHDTGHLILYEADDSADAFVLVTGRSPKKRIVGWTYGRDAKLDRYWRTDVKCSSWWVPQLALRLVKG